MQHRFNGHTVIVTGAASGLGNAMVRAFAREGANVAALDIAPVDIPAADMEGNVVNIPCDVSDETQVARSIDQCVSLYGKINVVCNNAGILRMGPRLHEVTTKQWDDVIAVNLRGAFFVMKYAITSMLTTGGGVIINTSSTSALRVRQGTGAYSPAKSALLRLTELAAIEYAADDIRVNAICPGPIDTAIFDGISAEDRSVMARSMPAGRFGRAEEVAALTAFLASDEARFITGGNYLIDGGRIHS